MGGIPGEYLHSHRLVEAVTDSRLGQAVVLFVPPPVTAAHGGFQYIHMPVPDGAIFDILLAVMSQVYRLLFQANGVRLGNEMIGGHPVENKVPSFHGRPGIDPGIEHPGIIDHAYQYGGFIYAEVGRLFLKESPGGIADAIYIVTERDIIEVEGEDLFLAEIPFQPDGDDPFF